MAGLVRSIYGVVAYGFYSRGTSSISSASSAISSFRNRSISARPVRFFRALIVDTMLLGLFAVQHSVMARRLQALVDAARSEAGRAQHLRAVREPRAAAAVLAVAADPDAVWTVHDPIAAAVCMPSSGSAGRWFCSARS